MKIGVKYLLDMLHEYLVFRKHIGYKKVSVPVVNKKDSGNFPPSFA